MAERKGNVMKETMLLSLTTDDLKDHVRILSRNLFYLWMFIASEDMQSEANRYIDQHIEEPTPFESCFGLPTEEYSNRLPF